LKPSKFTTKPGSSEEGENENGEKSTVPEFAHSSMVQEALGRLQN
jgi:hypothetical protein